LFCFHKLQLYAVPTLVVVKSKVINRGFSRQNHLGFNHYPNFYANFVKSPILK
jgi:hypothetical protein